MLYSTETTAQHDKKMLTNAHIHTNIWSVHTKHDRNFDN
jgi:hypothetical protein